MMVEIAYIFSIFFWHDIRYPESQQYAPKIACKHVLPLHDAIPSSPDIDHIVLRFAKQHVLQKMSI